MKLLFLLVSLTGISGSVIAQSDTTVTYYNRQWQPVNSDKAINYSLQIKENDHYKQLMVYGKDDKVKSIAYYTDAACKNADGPYREIYQNGKTSKSGYYYQGKKTGLWKTYTDNGVLTDSAAYKEGYIYGLNLSWYSDGKLADSSFFGEAGKGESYGFWSDGKPKHRGAYTAGKKEGPWTYYHKNGNRCQTVNYAADSALNYTCYDEQGNVQTKDCIYEQEALYPGGEGAWLRYLVNKLQRIKLPDDYYNGKIYGQVWIQFVVESDGSLSGIKVTESVDPRLDEAAVSVIKSSPRWNHAVQFNRPVKAYRLQPITFPKVE